MNSALIAAVIVENHPLSNAVEIDANVKSVFAQQRTRFLSVKMPNFIRISP
jgi:hypothetical protein